MAAQLTNTTRGAGAWAFGALGVSYLLRAVGDTASGAASFLTWLSPLGWAGKIEVFGEDRFVVAVIPLVVTSSSSRSPSPFRNVATSAPGCSPRARVRRRLPLRFGRRGLWPGGSNGRPGRLADRLCHRRQCPRRRGGKRVVDRLQPADAGPARKLGGNASSLTDTYISTELQFLAVGAAAYGISAALRLRSEENDLHTEQVLATSTRRSRCWPATR